MAQNPDPTPEQIRDECLLIRSTWTPAERMSRLRSDLRPQYTRCVGETEQMAAETYNWHHEQRALIQEQTR